ncbi:hypothetical protein [Desulfosudis oleivorans]|uniref:Uncharacterized protein n=1 Tax=Desulfosudis oleivorans (strain DSM 6200 / JCM 39069 / Hxd3) TaxID=96561 RepID=A8ZUN1_DESOH|nr:hypothetical protein [Desulfosudis oleivorans]ABW66444.1 hypothetical protein Dole_0634 [Desulfosudis oleivorans Hxd3]
MDKDLTYSREVARTLLKLFETGFAVDADAAHFIDSTLGCPGRKDLLDLFSLPDSDAAALVLDLVIAPDDSIRQAVEACLADRPGISVDSRALLDGLPETIPTALLFSDARGKIPCTVPRPAAKRLVCGLNLSKPIDPGLCESIKKALHRREDRLAVMAILRGCRVDLTGPAAPLVRAFVPRFPATDMSLFFSHLRLLLHILERPGAESDLFAALAAEQAACLQTLFRAARLEKQMAQNNMETLMMQGGRGLLAVDTGDLKQRLNMLNAVCTAIFERPLPADPAEEPLDFSWDKTV